MKAQQARWAAGDATIAEEISSKLPTFGDWLEAKRAELGALFMKVRATDPGFKDNSIVCQAQLALLEELEALWAARLTDGTSEPATAEEIKEAANA